MAKELFKNATVNNIRSLLQTFSATPLTSFSHFPSTCAINQEAHNQYARLELQFYDFQEAFTKFNLIAKACSQFGYRPEMFNVYNRIIIKLYTPHDNEKVLTLKDLYVSYFVDGLHSHNVEKAHETALEKLKELE
jgi:pterin-4a-carbinolamine dehydratase